MICPVCQKRKAKRYCPAKAATICAVCCGTEREVTIDCPSDCVYLMASREHSSGRREVAWERVPFADRKIPRHRVEARQDLLLELSYAICSFARDYPSLVDADVQTSLEALAGAYQTLASGIVYEQPPDSRLQRELYAALQAAVSHYKAEDRGQVMIARVSPLDSEIRDVLMFLAQFAAVRSNGRPKGRAFMDSLRAQFKPDSFTKTSSPLILAP